MKKLFVLRHAKSSWRDGSLSDFQRPLNRRGRDVAANMGALIARESLLPEYILCSPAERARQTVEHLLAASNAEIPVAFDQRIYEATSAMLFDVIREVPDHFESAMIVGHNPGFEGLVHGLAGRYERMPTAAIAVVELDIGEWTEISPGAGNLINVLRPKEQNP